MSDLQISKGYGYLHYPWGSELAFSFRIWFKLSQIRKVPFWGRQLFIDCILVNEIN